METYAKARKLAQKAYRTALLKGSYPYLQVLDEILSFTKTASEVNLGLVEIPLDLVVGTKTLGRTTAFSNNFLPLLPESSEFAAKWISLYHAHLEEGIRDPIKACEFMNRFYVIEGNKRVSVLKYSGAVSVTGQVTRILPEKNDSKEVRIYYEFLDFYQKTAVNYLWFSEEGSFSRLSALMNMDSDHIWTDDEKLDFHSSYIHFTDVFEEKGGRRLSLTPGDAFLLYLDVYGYEGFVEKPYSQIRREMEKLWKEFQLYPSKPPVELSMQPTAEIGKPVISRLIPSIPAPLQIAFLHEKTAEASSWTYGHELGRRHLDNVLEGQIYTRSYENINTEDLGAAAIREAIEDGCKIVFTTTPRLLGASIKAALVHPEAKILNCSLHTYSGHLRTYYGRMYEAKFLTGILAGILADSPRIGYLADYPIYGAIANINAFALGVRATNPKARVFLEWSTIREQKDPRESFREKGISYVSDQDLITPADASRAFGLYDIQNGKVVHMASSIWHWGKFYERIVREIQGGAWKKREQENKAINYWWGISSGMIDVICSKNLPSGAKWLMELAKKEIASGWNPFSGALMSQDGVIRCQEGKSLSPAEIITMDWLLDNVVGEIPAIDALTESAQPVVRLQGVRQMER